jgi:beta-lactamase superfamily II metal-dependent hydrolase
MSIIEGLPCGPVTINRHFEAVAPPDGPARLMMIELRRRGHPVEVVDGDLSSSVGNGASFEVLWPPAELPDGVAMQETSTVARLHYLGRSVLLTGDVEAYAIRELVSGEDVAANVLVLPNHGRVGRNTAELIASVGARFCVRSSNQRAGRTSQAFVDALGGRTCLNTAGDGAVSLVIDESGLTVLGYRGGSRLRY